MAAQRTAAAVNANGARGGATPFSDAVRMWQESLRAAGAPEELDAESIDVVDAVGRAPARVVRTIDPSPSYRAAAMDGFAIGTNSTASASAATPVRLRIGVDAVPIDTGAAMPEARDAVIPVEAADVASGDITVTSPVAAGKHVRLPGDDVPPGVAIGWPGFALRPVDCAALLASGCTTIDVVRRPRVAVIPSGDELVAPGSRMRRGSVIDSNSTMIAHAARALGAIVTVSPIVRDDEAAIRSALDAAVASSDVVVLLAGSSAGARDHGAAAFEAVGRVDVRGVLTRPARPVTLGHAGAVALANLPGYPVSCHFAFDAYVAPLLRRLGGFAEPHVRRARLARSIGTDGSSDEWRLASLLSAPGSPRAIVEPLTDIGGGLYRLAQAEARFHLRRGQTSHARHTAVEWAPLRGDDRAALPEFAGPYDPLIEELAALCSFRCRWTADESGAALDDGTADAVGVIVRGAQAKQPDVRAAEGRHMLVLGMRRECIAFVDASAKDRADDVNDEVLGDPWEAAAAVAAGTKPYARTTRFVAGRFGVPCVDTQPALYAVVWEERPGHRFGWGIALRAALGGLASASELLGWEYIGMGAEVR